MGGDFEHLPVLLEEVAEWMIPALKPEGTLLDCTLGGAGHAEALISGAPLGTRLVGIDRDQEALDAAEARLRRFGGRVRLVKGDFRDLTEILEAGDDPVVGILYDLGVSSPQLDRSYRGFQYRDDAPLDMRMDRSQLQTAQDVVNEYSERDLTRVLTEYGEERYARRIARAIVSARRREPIRTSVQVADLIKQAIPAPARRRGPHPARRTFQALRIEVNRELESLERSLPQAVGRLAPGGRIAVISYHSLEDRMAKRTFVEGERGCRCPSGLPVCVCGREAILRILSRRPIRPSAEEVVRNRRSASARLRVAERLGDPGEAA